MGKPIYVELDINAPIEDVWETTQNPKLHERWDLRFSQIDYLPKDHEDDVQTFQYETRIGFGLRIHASVNRSAVQQKTVERKYPL
ncbi:hypothetical protein [Geomicrobium sp. JCM 19038]|uniref:hypothetical protein n=1 Tax=Geomicrobium sp. JCM 19038 TaxID=1460635 RepID=UPI00045F4037|nr:hypothetical protein [Geomicrobium sp. JCM 19038]GAK06863.1 hypothetical protein JCM19038_573 [Geomicrobium sp. JCM 19038]